jgi:hypothetical protein
LAEEPAARHWSVTATVSGAQPEEGDGVLGSGQLSIERRYGDYLLGASLAGSSGEALAPELDVTTDQSGLFGSIWWGGALGDYDVLLSLGYGEQKLEGETTASQPPALSGLVIGVDGETQSSSIALSLARSFGEDVVVTPRIRVSYDRTETQLTATAADPVGASITVGEETSGVTGAVGVDVSGAAGEHVRLLGGAAYLATDEAAAQGFWVGRSGGARPATRQQEGAAQWGEAYLGLALTPIASTEISLTAGSTIGREQDEAFGSLAVAWSF